MAVAFSNRYRHHAASKNVRVEICRAVYERMCEYADIHTGVQMVMHVTGCASGSMVMSVLGAWGPRDAELRSHLSVLRGCVSLQ